jgi:hypothetical protein
MEPAGVERHRRSPQGEYRGETESIEVKVKEFPEESHATRVTQSIPLRESNPHLRFRKPPGDDSTQADQDLRTRSENVAPPRRPN